jgi:hypothetical protein
MHLNVSSNNDSLARMKLKKNMREVLGLKKRKRKADCTSEVIPSTKSVGGQALTSEGSPGIGEASG